MIDRRTFIKRAAIALTLLPFINSKEEVRFDGSKDFLGRADQSDNELFNGKFGIAFLNGRSLSDVEIETLFQNFKIVYR